MKESPSPALLKAGLLREEELLQRDMARYQQRASSTPQTPLPAEQARVCEGGKLCGIVAGYLVKTAFQHT